VSISSRIERVRAEDLLEEEQPTERAIRGGVGRRRQVAGLLVGLFGLPLLTLVLDASDVSLESVVLIYLLAVVVLAVIGGVLVAVVGAIAASLLINYFFVEPVHTLDIAHRHQALALVVFLIVAVVVSGAFDLATRRARAAEQAVAQAETMSALAGGELDEDSSLREVLDRAREAFQMESVVLKVRDRPTESWVDVERSGWAPPGHEAPLRFDVPANPHLRLVGRGPALFAEDQRVLGAFAAAAQTAYEGRQLSARAREATTLAETDRRRTALLGAVGDELPAPLGEIRAAVETLRDAPESARGPLLDAIEQSTRRLERVAADLLAASRLQAGVLAVEPRPIALAGAVDAVLAAIPGAERVHVDVPADLPSLLVDPGLLERALAILLDNALRRGDGGAVELSAVAGASSARVEIVDHGPRVTDEQRKHLLDALEGGATGSALGLAIAQGFVEALGGALVADAAADGGLTMRARLPLAGRGVTDDEP
jgi:two-component system, OmpR family, sensor histidine kinase KdpD